MDDRGRPAGTRPPRLRPGRFGRSFWQLVSVWGWFLLVAAGIIHSLQVLASPYRHFLPGPDAFLVLLGLLKSLGVVAALGGLVGACLAPDDLRPSADRVGGAA